MRVLIQANVDRDEKGGVQSVVRDVGARLREVGHAVYFSWVFGRDTGEPGKKERIDSFFTRPVSHPQGRRVHLPSLVKAIGLIALVRPNVVNVHFASANAYYFILLKRIFRYRLIVSCHGSDVLKPLPQDADCLPLLLQRADAVTGVSADLVEAIARHGVEKARIEYLPNGVNTEFWSPPIASEETPERAFEMVTVGRLDRVKGFDLLLDGFASLLAHIPRARLTIVGEGGERAALEQQAERLGLGDALSMPGTKTPDELRALLRRSDLFVLSSRSEGMPLALLEAMACGLPCVATNVGGVAETCGDAGRIVPPEDVGALAEALLKVASDRGAAREMAQHTREQALRFSAGSTMARYERLIASAG